VGAYLPGSVKTAGQNAMNCRKHPFRKAVGYCQACGDFYCEECLVTTPGGKRFCAKCGASRNGRSPGRSTESAAREDNVHLRLVAHFKTGKIVKGTAYKVDPMGEGFHMLRVGGRHHGQRYYIPFQEMKAVFHVKDFSGGSNVPKSAPDRHVSSGNEVKVYFKDGEIIDGFVHARYNAESARFSLIPKNQAGNNISIIIERTSVDRVEIGSSLKKLALNSLVDTPLRKKLLRHYWTNPQGRILLRHLAGTLGSLITKLQEALKPYVRMKLVLMQQDGEDTCLKFQPPADRQVRDFIIREYRHLNRPTVRKR